MKNSNQGMDYERSLEEITEDLRRTYLHIGELLNELEQKTNNKDNESTAAVSVEDTTIASAQPTRTVKRTTQQAPKPAEGITQPVPKTVSSGKIGNFKRETLQNFWKPKAKAVSDYPTNTVSDFKVGDRVYIISDIKKKSGPVTTKDRTGTVTGITKGWIYIDTDSGNGTRRLPHNIRSL